MRVRVSLIDFSREGEFQPACNERCRRPSLDAIAPEACRAWVERHFTHHVMAEGYLRMFRHYLATGALPDGMPIA
jgi:hypothetical protein